MSVDHCVYIHTVLYTYILKRLYPFCPLFLAFSLEKMNKQVIRKMCVCVSSTFFASSKASKLFSPLGSIFRWSLKSRLSRLSSTSKAPKTTINLKSCTSLFVETWKVFLRSLYLRYGTYFLINYSLNVLLYSYSSRPPTIFTFDCWCFPSFNNNWFHAMLVR